MSFPTSPVNGATTVVNGITYIYNATNNAWKRQALTSLTTGNITASGNVTAANISLTANVIFSDNSRLNTALVYDLDEMYADGNTNVFRPRYNQSSVSVSSPWNLLVTINGIFQPAFSENLDTVWLSSALCASRGYTVSAGNIKFADPPPAGTTVQARTQPGSAQTTTKIYPFKPVDIVLGM
jgi:hypothetical protein